MQTVGVGVGGQLKREIGGGIGRLRAMAREYGDLSVEYRHSEGREEIQPKPCKVQILARFKLKKQPKF